MVLSQAKRLIAIDSPLGPDVLLLRGFSGTEAVSRLFNFDLDLLSTDADIKFEDIIGKRVTIRVALREDKERFFNGFINRFMQTGSDKDLVNYRATMVPWLWFLTRTADCRIFQNKTVPDIIQQVFNDLGFTDVKTVLKGKYEPDDYCVQYRETDFNFVSRLMEQYGIFYFFEHEENKHTLVLADHVSAHPNCPQQPLISWNPNIRGNLKDDVITTLQWEQSFRSGKYAVTDYNFETPNTSLATQVNSGIQLDGNSKYEIYDFPGEYRKKAEGDMIAKLRMEEEEAQHYLVTGHSSCRVFTTGHKFTLQKYVRADLNSDYVLTQVHHLASVGSTYTTTDAPGNITEDYSNSFLCIPANTPFRPVQITPKPIVQGPQTAVVVGKKGEEIWTDKYARVKVQFHWDREGKKDENSSCWVRVSQNWAGKRWGAMFIPRIGQEVIVEFIEGDPDQPIITGRVYNAEQTPPYDLPAQQTKSTIKTNSSKGGSGFNELRFEDKKGEEQIFIHAEKNVDMRVKNDTYELVGNDRHLIVKKDQIEHVESNRNEKVDMDHVEEIGKDRHLKVAGKEAKEVGGSHSFTVRGDVIEVFKGNHSEQTTDDYYLKGTNIVIEAMSNVTIKVGGTYIAIEASGIKISGPQIEVEGQATAEIKSPMTTVKGDAMLTVKGGVVMIN